MEADRYDADSPERPRSERSRYAAFVTADGITVLYDSTNHLAWIESDTTVLTSQMA